MSHLRHVFRPEDELGKSRKLLSINAFKAHGVDFEYWGGFVYHFLLAEDKVMVTTVLPVLLKFTQLTGYNPVATGMIWAFAAGGKLFVYQSSVLIYGYSYGYFTARDLLKVAGILTLVEGIVLMVLVPLYWPLLGLPWRDAFPVPSLTRSADTPSHPQLPCIPLGRLGHPWI